MSELKDRYHTCKSIPSGECNTPSGLKFYGEVIHPAWTQDKATKQSKFLLPGEEVILSKVLTPDERWLQEIRAELDKLTHIASFRNIYGRT